jgi:hypothetical protein
VRQRILRRLKTKLTVDPLAFLDEVAKDAN